MIMATAPSQAGAVRMPPATTTFDERIDALQATVRELSDRRSKLRPERLSGMHNPWGHAAVLANAWRFLDLCEDAAVLDTVAEVIGPDIVLWDSELHLDAASYVRFAAQGREGRYWPAVPLAGAVVLIAPIRAVHSFMCLDVASLANADLSGFNPDTPLYVIRYMPATSRFVRDARSRANWAAMEEQPLINYATRPLWLVRGEDRAGNDFVTGFAPSVPRWAGIQPEEH
jgi:hypothetical protein